MSMEVTDIANVLYQSWDVEAMRESGDVASCSQLPSSTGFTAINQHPTQLTSPSQSSPTQQTQAKVRTTSRSSRRRNPTVASYLGLGDSSEPAHLVEYAPTPDGQPPQQPTRKRRVPRTGERTSTKKRANTNSKQAPTQPHVSEILRVANELSRSVTHELDGSTEDPLPTPASYGLPQTITSTFESPQTYREHQTRQCFDAKRDLSAPAESSRTQSAILVDDDDEFGQLCFDFEPRTSTPDNSNQQEIPSEELTQHAESHLNEDDFDDDLMDDDLLDIRTDTIDSSSSPRYQSSSPTKHLIVDESCHSTQAPDTPANAASPPDEVPSSSNSISERFVSPITLTTRLLAATGDEARKPIVRPPFPAAVRDRLPIIGMTSNTLLRTCFRVGEAISQSCHAVKAGNNILIELYARVLNSERNDSQQRFTFCDLFHAKPPYIQATYAATIWKTVQLFEYDSARLLQQGRICRCMGTMKRDGKDWVMIVLNIWEATWDDVQWVEGIVNS